MSKARQKAMKRDGTKRRWSDNSALPGHKSGDMLRRHADKRAQGLTLQDLTGANFRRLAHMSMNPASMSESLPKDSNAYPRQVVKLKRVEIRQEEQIEYRVLWLCNGEGYKEAMVFASDGPGFWYCLYDVDIGSYVSAFKYTDKQLFQFEREQGLLKRHLRLVTYKEPQFVIADRRV